MRQESVQKTGVGSKIKQFIFLASMAGMLIVFTYLYVSDLRSESVAAEPAMPGVVKEISAVTQLPEDIPQIMRVEHAELLRELNPRIYDAVQRGDILLEYDQLIVMYRPSEKRVIQSIRK